MTTIAANLECMAADRRVSDTDENGSFTGWTYPTKKLFRVGNSIFGTSGAGGPGLVLIEWLRSNRSRFALYKQLSEAVRDEFRILELRGPLNRRVGSKLYVWDGWGIAEPVLADFVAIGSGAKAAGALLVKGVDPESAVRGASGQDFFTGSHVDVEHLLPPELRTKRKRG